MAKPVLPEFCGLRDLHGKWTDPNRTVCSQCGWKMPEDASGPKPRKTFHEGSWRVFTYRGAVGARCDPPSAEERTRWAEEDETTDFPPITEPPPKGTRVYKVVTQRDEFFAGEFDPLKLSKRLNDLALDGWRVVAVATADVSTFFGTFWAGRGARQEMVAFLEKIVE